MIKIFEINFILILLNIPYVAQANPQIVIKKRITKSNVVCVANKMILQNISDNVVGKRQYPSTQTDWKNDLKTKYYFLFCCISNYSYSFQYMLPPSSFEFKVTIIDPIQTMTKTSANSGPPSLLSLLFPCRTVAINVHKIKGPHKSPKNQ